MLEKLDELIFGRGKLFVYIIGIVLIIYFDKWDYEKVQKIILLIGQITLLWIIIKVLRIYLIKYVEKFNRILFNNFRILIKIRKYFFDIPLLLRIILSLYIFLDKFLIKILFLETRKRNWFYFLRRFLYLNILIWVSLPFYFFKELYGIILVIVELNEISLKDIIWLRAHFLFLTIICVLLLDIERIDFIIFAWIIDVVVIKIYYEWLKEWKQMYTFNEFDLRITCMNMQSSFYQVRMNYNEYCNSLISDISPLRRRVLLVYKGLTKEEINLCKISLFEKFIEIYNNWWNDYYSQFLLSNSNSFDYYDSKNDEQFILVILNKVIEIFGDNKDNTIQISDIEIYKYLEEIFDKRFNFKQYIFIKNVIKRIKEDDKLLVKFFHLRVKYDFTFYENFTNEEDIKEFFKELYKGK